MDGPAIRAVRLYLRNGHSIRALAVRLGVNEHTAGEWVRRVRALDEEGAQGDGRDVV